MLWCGFVTALLVLAVSLAVVVRLGYPLRYEATIVRTCEEHRVDPYLVAAVICAESRFRIDAVSSAGAVGLMQLMPDTAVWVAVQDRLTGFSVSQLVLPEVNLQLGIWYLAHLLERYSGDRSLALAAYNAGPTAVDRWLDEEGELPHGVMAYVGRIERSVVRYRFWYEAPLWGALLRSLPL